MSQSHRTKFIRYDASDLNTFNEYRCSAQRYQYQLILSQVLPYRYNKTSPPGQGSRPSPLRKELGIQRQLRVRIDLFNKTGSSICTNLGKSAHISLIKVEGNDRISSAFQTLIYNPGNSVVARVIKLHTRTYVYSATDVFRQKDRVLTIFVNHRNSPPAMLFITIPNPAAQLRDRTVMP